MKVVKKYCIGDLVTPFEDDTVNCFINCFQNANYVIDKVNFDRINPEHTDHLMGKMKSYFLSVNTPLLVIGCTWTTQH